jgi:hypothetical protein
VEDEDEGNSQLDDESMDGNNENNIKVSKSKKKRKKR